MRDAVRGSTPTGAERIAIARRLAQLDIADDGAEDRAARRLPSCAYLLCGGRVIRRPADHDGAGGAEDDAVTDELIDDLARAGALIAAEIDRLQQLPRRSRP